MKNGHPRLERERRRRANYREAVLHAAERVIVRKGFGATRMDDVAREAQLSKATLYRYVPSKGALLFEIMGHYFEDVGAGIEAIRAGEGTATEKFRLALRMILRFSEDKKNIGRMLWVDDSMLKVVRVLASGPGRSGPASSADRRLLESLRRKRLDALAVGAKILDEGVSSGEFRPMDTMNALNFIDAVIQGYAHNQFWLGDRPMSEDAPNRLARFILEGIQNPDRSGKEK
jgi:AcrR family transcriptional regulator